MRAHAISMSFTLLLALSPLAGAQMGMNHQAAAAPGTTSTPAAAFDSEVSLVESEFVPAVKAMPEEKFAFAPAAAIFAPGQSPEFAGVRTFAQQATHVASANYYFGTVISGLKPDMDPKLIQKMTSKEDIVRAVAGSFTFLHKAVATLTPENSFDVVKSPEPGLQTRATMASFAVSHCFDHYGQMVEYLRMNGIVPPASAK